MGRGSCVLTTSVGDFKGTTYQASMETLAIESDFSLSPFNLPGNLTAIQAQNGLHIFSKPLRAWTTFSADLSASAFSDPYFD